MRKLPPPRSSACWRGRSKLQMKEKNFSKAEMAKRMRTNRAALDRLLDPQNNAVTLSTLQKAAFAVGREIRLELV